MSFEERHEKIFYGRRDLTEQLIQVLSERLVGDGILVMTGVSGAGKSSLLRAGLIPRLSAGALGLGSGGWPCRVLRPTANPLKELAVHLADLVGLDPPSVYRSLAQAPHHAPLIIEQGLIRLSSGTGQRGHYSSAVLPSPRMVLVIDQFEELFIAAEDDQSAWLERDAFVAALHAVASVPVSSTGTPGALVLIAVRSDFLGRVVTLPALAAAMSTGPFTVGPMTEANAAGYHRPRRRGRSRAWLDRNGNVRRTRPRRTRWPRQRRSAADIAGHGSHLGAAGRRNPHPTWVSPDRRSR